MAAGSQLGGTSPLQATGAWQELYKKLGIVPWIVKQREKKILILRMARLLSIRKRCEVGKEGERQRLAAEC